MRLKAREIAAIKAAASEAFGTDAIVRLFGSRIDDRLRGGDIDLHVEIRDQDDLRRAEVGFRVELSDRLDEEPVDIVVYQRGKPRRWIDDVAYRDGIVL